MEKEKGKAKGVMILYSFFSLIRSCFVKRGKENSLASPVELLIELKKITSLVKLSYTKRDLSRVKHLPEIRNDKYLKSLCKEGQYECDITKEKSVPLQYCRQLTFLLLDLSPPK